MPLENPGNIQFEYIAHLCSFFPSSYVQVNIQFFPSVSTYSSPSTHGIHFYFLYILPGRTIFEFVDTPQQNQVTQIELYKTHAAVCLM